MAKQRRAKNPQSTRARRGRHRIQKQRPEPYSWLGAGAVTLGLGAALASGSGIAHADTTPHDGQPSSSTHEKTTPPAPSGTAAAGGSRSSSAGGRHTDTTDAVDGAAVGTDSGTTPKMHGTQNNPVSPSGGHRTVGDNLTAGHLSVRAAATAITPTGDASSPAPSGPQPRVPVAAVVNRTPVTSTAPTTSTAPLTQTHFEAVTKTAIANAVVTNAVVTNAAVPNAAVPNAAVTAPITPVASPFVPVLNLVAGVLTIFGVNPQGPTPPASPVGALLWGLFRQFETTVGVAPPVVGTATVGPPNPATGAVSGNLGATEQAGLPLTYTVTTAPGDGTVTVDSTGAYTYTPTPAARLLASVGGPTVDGFVVTISDGLAGTNESVNVPISAVVDRPTAPIALSETVNTTTGAVTGTLTSTDSLGLPLTYSAASNPASGTVTVTAAGGYTYSPSLLAQEQASVGGPTTDSFTVTATNGTYTSTAGTISVPITAIADTPAAPTSATQSTAASGVVIGTVTSIDPAGKTLTYSATTNPASGTVTVTAAGGYTYTPSLLAQEQASVGGPMTDSFTVTASNGTYTSAAGTISVPITAVADTPAAPTSASQSADVSGVVTGAVTATDPAGKSLTYSAASNPANGTVTVTAAGGYTYTPSLLAQEQASVGGPTTDSFTVTATNGTYTSAAGTVSVPITAVADTPSAPTSATQLTSAGGVVTGTVTATDPAGKSLTYSAASNPANGTVTVTAAGGYTYTPSLLAQEQASVGGATSDSFTVAASNGTYTSAAGTVSVPISAIADTPSAPQSASQSTDASGVVTGTVTATDPAGKSLTYSAVANGGPASGTVTVTAAGGYTYTPSALAQEQASVGGPTTDSFTVTATNGTYTSSAGTISVPITAVADTPSAPTSATQLTTVGGVVTGTVTATDPAGKSLTYSAASNPANGTVTVTVAGGYTYTPSLLAQEQASVGGPTTDSFTVTATNGTYTSTAGTISVPITAIADTPSAPQSASQSADASGLVTGTLTSTDPAGKTLTYSAASNPAYGTVTVTATGGYTYTPSLLAQEQASVGGATSDSFTVTASNGTYTSTPGSISVPITAVADTPTAPTSATQSTNASGVVTGTVTATDPGGKTLTYSAANNPAYGTVTVTATGGYTYTPSLLAQEQASVGGPTTDSFTVTATNGTYTSTAGTISVPITAVADTPSAPQSASQSADASGLVTGTLTSTDPAGKTLTYSAASNPAYGTVTVTATGGYTYTPSTLAQAQAGTGGPTTDSFTVTATNGTYTSVAGTVSVPITAIADIPSTPQSASQSTSATGVVTGTLTSIDPAGKTLTYSATSNPTNGTVTVTAAGGYTYTPTQAAELLAAQGGPTIDSFTVTASNGTDTSAVGTIAVPITKSTAVVASSINLPGANAVAVNPNGNVAYIASSSSDTVSVINTATNTVTNTIALPTGSAPDAVVVSPNGKTAYVYTNTGNGSVAVINTATNTVTNTIALPNRITGIIPQGMAISPDGSTLYVSNLDSVDFGSVAVINTATNSVTNSIALGATPLGLAVSPTGNTAYVVAGSGSHYTLRVIDTNPASPTYDTVTTSIPIFGNIAGGPGQVLLNASGATAYVYGHGTEVQEINTATDTVSNSMTFPTAVTRMSLSPDGSIAYVVSGGNTVSVVNTATNAVLATLPAFDASAVSVSPDGSFAYVINPGEPTEVISVGPNTAVPDVPIAGTPTQAAPNLTSGAVTGTSTFIDSAGTALSYSVTTLPTQGTVTVNSTTGAYTYTPTPADRPAPLSPNGTDSFIVTASNGVNSAPETISVSVIPAVPPTTNVAVGTSPRALQVSPDGKTLYVVNAGNGTTAGTVSVLNTSTDTITKTVTVGVDPFAIAENSTGTTIYVVNGGPENTSGYRVTSTVSVISASTGTVTATVPLNAGGGSIVVSPNGATVYVNTGNGLVEINTATNTIAKTVPLTYYIDGSINISPDGKTLYFSDTGSGTESLEMFDTTTNTVTRDIPVGFAFGTSAISADGKTLYYPSESAGVVKINTSTGAIEGTVPVGGNENGYPDSIAVSPDGTMLYVGDGEVGNDDIFVINNLTNSVTEVPVGGTPEAVAVSPDGKTLYVANIDTGTVTIIPTGK